MGSLIAVTACLKRCSVAVAVGNVVREINEDVDAAANLVHLANKLLKAQNIAPNELVGVITASGPGSFTGIRVAQSFARGIALALKIPAASVSYFDVIRSVCEEKIAADDTLTVIKSEKEQIYYEINSGNFRKAGVAAADDLECPLSERFWLLGDAVDEVSPHFAGKIVGVCAVDDFRNAAHLLNFSGILCESSKIDTLYISAQSRP
ncbi:MAG: tRNA (adenosine(37)-N6)-threonylcarbamoyltransferase complex dimerization subunit type 1 TsaB [Holosporaceae bacterium]|jgi:tRNA threonylcarbamoyl adenosine modification protein YeaZ|nr:tRNA (adenosine(37)-N6)-threonylcarbamoyltransferase complex dimerization subunit type 1 TsaB [Holosporaceae bacterium]